MEEFEIGDVVRLNSDTVRMTVSKVESGRVTAEWHDASDALIESDFGARQLTLVKAGWKRDQ
jgi:uncharacterized protein YodC (DUF2158 family)